MQDELQADGAIAPTAARVPSCALDEQGLELQRARYLRMAPSVLGVRREAQLITIDFAPDFDAQVLDELIAVERGCCPFFAISFDPRARRLQVGVEDPEHVPALEAIEYGFSA